MQLSFNFIEISTQPDSIAIADKLPPKSGFWWLILTSKGTTRKLLSIIVFNGAAELRCYWNMSMNILCISISVL